MASKNAFLQRPVIEKLLNKFTQRYYLNLIIRNRKLLLGRQRQIKKVCLLLNPFTENTICHGVIKDKTIIIQKKYYLKVLPEWFKKLRLVDINNKEVEMLQSYFIKQQYSTATCNRYISILKASMTKAYEWELISEKKLKSIRKVKPLKGENKRLRYLNSEEIQRLLDVCDKHLYPIVFIALHTGMRKGEILNLKWDMIDLKNDLILLDKTKKLRKKRNSN